MRNRPLAAKPIAYLDVETSGLNPNEHEILDIAIVFDVNAILRSDGADWTKGLQYTDDIAYFSTKVRPSRIERAEPEALAVNGYNDVAWYGAPAFAAIAERVNGYLEHSVIAGHSVHFDVGFIEAEIKRAGYTPKLSRHHIDTITLGHEHLVRGGLNSLRLDLICSYLGISNEGNHTALSDARRCRLIHRKLDRATALHRLWWRVKSCHSAGRFSFWP